MSLNRLTFLYPHLWKCARGSPPPTPTFPPPNGRPLRLDGKRSRSSTSSRSRSKTFSTISHHHEETFPQRYGTAAEPQPLLFRGEGEGKGDGVKAEGKGNSRAEGGTADQSKTLADVIEKEVNAPALAPAPPRPEKRIGASTSTSTSQVKEDSTSPTTTTQESSAAAQGSTSKLLSSSSPADETTSAGVSSPSPKMPPLSSANSISTETPKEPTITDRPTSNLEASPQPPQNENEEDHKPPHLQAPPYVHHFDSYTIVRDLKKGGFTQDQSVTLTKAVRSLLGVNLDIARQGLVSKSDMENETYLFRAACSELRTEILNARKASTNKMATQRAHLQHEVDILSQKASQEALTLKDDLRGMLNDRRMDVRMEQQARDSAIQELNYKITVALNSDSKGEIEGLRWILTRRAAMAIAGMALLILGSLRYSSYLQQQQQQQPPSSSSTSCSLNSTNNNSPKNSEGGGGGGGGDGGGVIGVFRPTYTVPARDMGTQTDEVVAVDGIGSGSVESLG